MYLLSYLNYQDEAYGLTICVSAEVHERCVKTDKDMLYVPILDETQDF